MYCGTSLLCNVFLGYDPFSCVISFSLSSPITIHLINPFISYPSNLSIHSILLLSFDSPLSLFTLHLSYIHHSITSYTIILSITSNPIPSLIPSHLIQSICDPHHTELPIYLIFTPVNSTFPIYLSFY